MFINKSYNLIHTFDNVDISVNCSTNVNNVNNKTNVNSNKCKPQINCLEYALFFWKEQPRYRIYYNSDHVINLPDNSTCDGFLPIEEFGYEHLLSSFTLSDQAKEILKEYFK